MFYLLLAVFAAAIVGAEIAWFEAGFTPAFWPAYAFNAFTVGLGQMVACYLLGSLLLVSLPRIPFLRCMLPPSGRFSA